MKNLGRFLAIIFVFIPLLYFVGAFCLIRWQTSRSSAFDKKVVSLPHQELEDFALRCNALWLKSHTNHMIAITNKDTLHQFALVGKTPLTIEVFDNFVDVRYLYSGRFGAAITWTDYSMWDEPVWKLEAHSGDTEGFVLYALQKQTNSQSIKTNSP
jgi:hypothetical protein